MIEYRICWAASSNVSFHGESDWAEWDGFEKTPDEVLDTLNKPDGANRSALPVGLEEALECSGFEWWAETRASDEEVGG